jgi:hypothetical protein
LFWFTFITKSSSFWSHFVDVQLSKFAKCANTAWPLKKFLAKI